MSAPTSGLDIVFIGGLSSSSACVQKQREGSSSSSSSTESSSSSSARMQFESSTGSAMQFESSRGQLLPREDGIFADDDGARTTPRQQQQQQQQQQIQTTGATANVGELVSKAKKAAASLWMILHAQNCRLPDDKCPHRGCHETKLLLAHVKPCPAGPDFPCPSRRRGCNETRKLLAHYRRCKDIRTRQQVGLLGGRRSLLQHQQQQQQQPDQGSSCLVCSLVARHARSAMIDRTSVGVGGDSRGKNGVVLASLLSSSLDGKFHVERGLAGRTLVPATTTFERTPSMTLMPPPPPRYGSCPSSSASASSSSNESFSLRASDRVNLNKSVDSSAGASLPILRRPGKRMEPAEDDSIVPGRNVAAAAISATSPRQRARSYDERQTRVKFAPVVIAECDPRRFDERGDEGEGRRVTKPRSSIRNKARPRSASCSNSDVGNATISSTSRGFEAIVEEGVVDCEEPMFSMDL